MEDHEFEEVKRRKDIFMAEYREYYEREHTKSIAKLIGITPDDEDDVNGVYQSMQKEVRRRPPIQEPVLLNDDGCPILCFILYNFPSNTTANDVKVMMQNNEITIDRFNMCPKTNNGRSVFVDCHSLRDSLNLQICCLQKKLFSSTSKGKRFVRVKPAHKSFLKSPKRHNQYIPSSQSNKSQEVEIYGKRSKSSQYKAQSCTQISSSLKPSLDRLPDLAFEIILDYLSLKDTFRIMCTSKSLAKKVCMLPRDIKITSEVGKSVTMKDINFLLNPLNWESNILVPIFKRIVLNDTRFCNKIDGPIIKKMLPKINQQNHLVEIDISGITISPNMLIDISKRCPELNKFILGDTTGACDTYIASLFSNSAVTNRIKHFGVSNNNHYTGRSLMKFEVNELTKIILKNCKKLHVSYIKEFITVSGKLTNLHLENCSHVLTSPKMNEIVNALGESNLKIFALTSDEEYSAHYEFWNIDKQWIKKANTLNAITIGGYKGINPIAILNIISNCPNLKHVTIEDFILRNIDLNLENCTLLETLVLNGSQGINQDFWDKEYQSLKKLSLKKVKNLNGYGILKFINKNKNSIEIIDLTDAQLEKNFEIVAILERMSWTFFRPPVRVIMNTRQMTNLRSIANFQTKSDIPMAILVDTEAKND